MKRVVVGPGALRHRGVFAKPGSTIEVDDGVAATFTRMGLVRPAEESQAAPLSGPSPSSEPKGDQGRKRKG